MMKYVNKLYSFAVIFIGINNEYYCVASEVMALCIVIFVYVIVMLLDVIFFALGCSLTGDLLDEAWQR